MVAFRYDTQKTQALGAALDEIQLDAAQKQLVRDLADVTSPVIGLDPIPCHGLWLRAVRVWQIDMNAPATSVSKMDPGGRLRAALQIRDRFVALASEMLRSPEQAASLARAVEGAYDLYMQKYNRR